MAKVEVESHQGRNLLFGEISVSAGTTQLVAAPSDNQRVKIVTYAVVATAAATVAWTDGTRTTGAMSFAANGGISCASQASSPLWATNDGAALSIVTTGGDVEGHFSYVVEP